LTEINGPNHAAPSCSSRGSGTRDWHLEEPTHSKSKIW